MDALQTSFAQNVENVCELWCIKRIAKPFLFF